MSEDWIDPFIWAFVVLVVVACVVVAIVVMLG